MANYLTEITIYYHDPVEVQPSTSWTGLCQPLSPAKRVHVSKAINPKVLALFEYARPDAVITIDGNPLVSIEQTAMNPSGHNIPQRFSFHVRAAELGVPSILYYPEHSRRTYSDPNERNLQVRVPLAQKRLSSIYQVPAVSIFWPTNERTKLPDRNPAVHIEMAEVVGELIENFGSDSTQLPSIRRALQKMDTAVTRYASSEGDYDTNASVRSLFPAGFSTARTAGGIAIDPPNKSKLFRTNDFLGSLHNYSKRAYWSEIEEKLNQREYTLVFSATANSGKIDSEHPWPGYLTLLDILYLRKDGGRSPTYRIGNLVYQLPVQLSKFLPRLAAPKQPTATHIVDVFSDLIMLDGGVVAGRPMRESRRAEPILVR